MALGVDIQSHKDILGISVSDTEGAKFWFSVLTDLRSRGVNDIFIACVDGLKGFPEAINSEYPETQVYFALSIWFAIACASCLGRTTRWSPLI